MIMATEKQLMISCSCLIITIALSVVLFEIVTT